MFYFTVHCFFARAQSPTGKMSVGKHNGCADSEIGYGLLNVCFIELLREQFTQLNTITVLKS